MERNQRKDTKQQQEGDQSRGLFENSLVVAESECAKYEHQLERKM